MDVQSLARSLLSVFIWAHLGWAIAQSPDARGTESERARRGSDELFTTLAEAVPELLGQHDCAGLAVGVVRDGGVAFVEGYGVADKANGREVTPDTVFNMASVSKVVTAWGVMQWVEAGELALDEPVETYWERWRLPGSEFDSKGVTVRRLMSHTAGLSMHAIPGFRVPRPLPILEEILAGDYRGSYYASPGSPVELISEPGSEWRYSGGGTVLLQLVIEELSLGPFSEYMSTRVLEPLGMTNSRFGWDESLADRAAVPYGTNGRALPTYRFTGTSGAGLYSTAADMARFVAAGLRSSDGAAPGRDLLTPATLELMHTPVPLNDGQPSRCGLGYFLDEGAELGLKTGSHDGSNAGWRTLFIGVPASGDGLVVLANSDNSGPVLQAVTCLWGNAELGVALGCE